jgi:hypothetical protein
VRREFNDMFSGYPSGFFKIIKEAIGKYVKRRTANKGRYENFMTCQGFEMSDAEFKRIEGGGFNADFEVVSYEYFADAFIPKAVMNISVRGNTASIHISSAWAHVHENLEVD